MPLLVWGLLYTEVMYYGHSLTDGLFHNVRIPQGGPPLPSTLRASRKASEKRKNRRDVNYLKSLILHRRYKKYDKRSFDSVPI